MEILFRKRVRELRKEKQETQKQVAEAVGLKERHYQFFEYGKHFPSLENLWKLADHFEVSIDYLVGRSDER